MKLNAVCFAVGCVFLVVMISGSGLSFAETPYSELSANRDIPNLVPYELVERIAMLKAGQKWGQVAPGPVLPCCDDNGDLVAYMFVFAIGTAESPSAEAIRASVLEGRKIAEEGLAALSEPERKALIDTAAKDAPPPDAEQNRGDSRATEAAQSTANAKAQALGSRKSIGAGDFGTVVVSAREDRFPVPLYMHYLPPYFSTGDLAAKSATTGLGVSEVKLERVYFLGRARGQYFEFRGNDRTILIDAQHLEVASPEKALLRKGQKAANDPEQAAAIAQAWATVKTEVR
jgi:hypothetical protein